MTQIDDGMSDPAGIITNMNCLLLTPETGAIEAWPTDDQLGFLQGHIGGYVETIQLGPDVVLWVDEDGKMKDLPINPWATRLFQHTYGPTQVIVGNAVITAGADDEGTTLGLSAADATTLLEYAAGQ